MKEYRKTIELNDDDYLFVELGPKPGVPAWHCQSSPSRYPFPDEAAATQFARAHKIEDPSRDVVLRLPDGRGWNGKEWV